MLTVIAIIDFSASTLNENANVADIEPKRVGPISD